MTRAGNFGPTWSVFLSGKVAHIELIVLYMHIHPPFPSEPVPCSHKWQQNKWFMWHFWLYWTQWLKENNLMKLVWNYIHCFFDFFVYAHSTTFSDTENENLMNEGFILPSFWEFGQTNDDSSPEIHIVLWWEFLCLCQLKCFTQSSGSILNSYLSRYVTL